MRIVQSVMLAVVIVVLAACSAGSPGWLRGDASYTVPSITNNG